MLTAGMQRRREFLISASGALAAGLAGCLGGAGPLGGGSGDGTSTPGDVTQLSSLEVGPSPGGEVAVRRAGTASLVDFFATWCAPCKPQMENLNTVRSEFGEDELYMTSVTNETDEGAIRDFWTEYDGNWPVLMDPDLEATQQFEVKGVPTLVLLDGGGQVTWRHRGLAGADSLMEHVTEAVEG